MSITLIAKDDVPVSKIGDLLTGEGAEPLSVLRLGEVLDGGKTAGDADLIFLISTGQDFLSAGEAVSRIRGVLGDGQKLILCIMPSPFKDQYSQLQSYGAEEIISTAGPNAEQIAERVLAHLILKRRVTPYNLGNVLGATSAMREVYEKVRMYAPLEESVLLRGETGTGKGLLAEELHIETLKQTDRRGKFVHVQCTALNPGGVEDELFGHGKGSFTGALAARKGLVEEAQNGTLFLDEIGDFDHGLQIKVLDLIENKRVRPLGINDFRKVDVRFIFATHCPLERFVEEGRFRRDLFGRINELTLELPPLRRRKADIPLLVEHFVNVFNEKYHRNVTLGGGAVDELFGYDWRLNVRGLRSVVRKTAASVGADGVITHFILSDGDREPAEQGPYDVNETPRGEVVEIDPRSNTWSALHARFRKSYFTALAACSESMEHASKLSEIGRSQLYEIFKEYDLHLGGKPLRSTRRKRDEDLTD